MAVLVLVFEAGLDVCVEHKFHVVGPFEALIEYFVDNFTVEHARCCLDFTLDGSELVTTHSFESLEVGEVDVLALELTEAVDIAWLVITVEISRFHIKFLG